MERFKQQPAAVWAVLLACVVAFMGIGLVDPILPIIAKGLHASPSQVELLFTSYFAIIGLANLFSGWVSSRIGVMPVTRSPSAMSSTWCVDCTGTASRLATESVASNRRTISSIGALVSVSA